MDSGDRTQALKDLQEARREDPSAAEVCDLIGRLYEREQKLDDAMAAFRDAVRVRPSYAAAWNEIAVLTFISGRYPEALEVLKEATKDCGEKSELLNNRGAVLRAMGDASGADSCFRRAIALDMRNAVATANHACMLFQQGRTKEAFDAWQTAAYINPGYADASAGLAVGLWASGRHRQAYQALTRACVSNSLYGNPDAVARRYLWPPRAIAVLREVLEDLPHKEFVTMHSPLAFGMFGCVQDMPDPATSYAPSRRR